MFEQHKEKLADIERQITRTEHQIVKQAGLIRVLQARGQAAREEIEMLRLTVSALAVMKKQRTEMQAFLGCMDRLIDPA